MGLPGSGQAKSGKRLAAATVRTEIQKAFRVLRRPTNSRRMMGQAESVRSLAAEADRRMADQRLRPAEDTLEPILFRREPPPDPTVCGSISGIPVRASGTSAALRRGQSNHQEGHGMADRPQARAWKQRGV